MAQHLYLTTLRHTLKTQPRVRAFFESAKPIIVNGLITGAYDVDEEKVTRVLELMARAVYFHHFARKWKGPLVLTVPPFLRLRAMASPEYGEKLSVAERGADVFFRDHPRHGENPAVFYYQVHEDQATREIALRLVFYETFSLTAIRRKALPKLTG